ncbi:unnamed protein product [Symbiodinium necroappetens]|uniref:JmjC domain-containing protein n=1 Tax=Symbiodinium necroappetens TaxID=1628268 RepID=A0A813BN36_9DINO|nr:unnamed protein product [Symbiodinium necroappetens]
MARGRMPVLRVCAAVLAVPAFQIWEVQAQEQRCSQGVCSSTGAGTAREDASLLQAHPVSELTQARHAKDAVKRRHKHHSQTHNKIVDGRDYRADAAEYFEKVKHDSLEDRCPHIRTMTLKEVSQRWHEELEQLKEDTPREKFDKKFKDFRHAFPGLLHDNKPVLIKGHVPKQLGWRAATHWGKDELADFLGDLPWQRQSFDYPDWVYSTHNLTTFREYVGHDDSARNIFLFGSEDGCDKRGDLKKTMDKIRGQFIPSPDFAWGPEVCEAIVAIDSIGSSHGFHCHDPVWQVQVQGYKMWWLLPPHYRGTAPESDTTDDSIGWGGSPVLPDGTVFAHPNGCAMLKQVEPPPGTKSCLVGPGEMMVLPVGWVHSTCGLTNYTAAAGGWLGYYRS